MSESLRGFAETVAVWAGRTVLNRTNEAQIDKNIRINFSCKFQFPKRTSFVSKILLAGVAGPSRREHPFRQKRPVERANTCLKFRRQAKICEISCTQQLHLPWLRYEVLLVKIPVGDGKNSLVCEEKTTRG
jgi:hypothetical protein